MQPHLNPEEIDLILDFVQQSYDLTDRGLTRHIRAIAALSMISKRYMLDLATYLVSRVIGDPDMDSDGTNWEHIPHIRTRQMLFARHPGMGFPIFGWPSSSSQNQNHSSDSNRVVKSELCVFDESQHDGVAPITTEIWLRLCGHCAQYTFNNANVMVKICHFNASECAIQMKKKDYRRDTILDSFVVFGARFIEALFPAVDLCEIQPWGAPSASALEDDKYPRDKMHSVRGRPMAFSFDD